MIIQPFSDIHCYDLSFQPKKTYSDVLICAGDFDMGLRTNIWNDRVIKEHEKPFIKILGNHDYWNTSSTVGMTMDDWNDYYKSLENEFVSYLINETKVINGVAFIGATLWSDFKNNDLIVRSASKISKDYTKIIKNYGITSDEIYDEYIKARTFIINELTKHSDKKCVVITHFPPSISCNYTYQINPASYYWCGQMEDIISEFQPVLWISGHMHNSFDALMGDSRVILNPAGQVKNSIYQNPQFNDSLNIKI